MTAFDSDVLTLMLAGDPAYLTRLHGVAPADRYVPVVVAAEVTRGWLNAIRRAEAGKGRMSLVRAFEKFDQGLENLAEYHSLPYTPAADALVRQWRTAKLRVGTNDLRIAAICIDHGAKLVTRNARDYALVPGLNLEVWN
jgi:tRNA(fMet)-specific endonuclease VapC